MQSLLTNTFSPLASPNSSAILPALERASTTTQMNNNASIPLVKS
ncbi:MAG TPA: hypothetical protein PLT82_06545 [Candidatus Hydrogenedens sp.]|nr:hypothetical protein [Candidatus Hydrogenedens sp.]HOL19133.1 hypothetical protein [Candidatus Hydrogenedens sp.]HPP58775.1 hypothetical protein [Candidatus Hydrogenedens sp.]